MSELENIQYKLTHEKGRPVFELVNPASTNAKIESATSLNLFAKAIEIKQKWLLLDSPMKIHNQGSVIGTMEFVWTNDIVVYLKDSSGNTEIYQIIAKGFINRYYILMDAYDQILFKMNKENIIEIKSPVEQGIDARLLLVLFGYAIYLIQWR